jgi:hypothetical protein
MKFLLALLLASALSQTAAAALDASCNEWTDQILAGQGEACSDLCPQAHQFDSYDYVSGLKAALASHSGLTKFLSYAGRSSIIGAGADAQACTLVAVLDRWGDAVFASEIARQPAKSRARIVGLLDYASPEDFAKRFPKTYASAAHE